MTTATTPRILVPLAEGFEEIEAIVPIDVWRRAKFEVISASLAPGVVRASRQTRHTADQLLLNVLPDSFDLIFLPGGMPGAKYLAGHPHLKRKLTEQAQAGKWIAAICAGPMVLDQHGLLEGKRFTCHPSVREKLTQKAIDTPLVVDGKIVTAVGPGVAFEFALMVVQLLGGRALAEKVHAELMASDALLPAMP